MKKLIIGFRLVLFVVMILSCSMFLASCVSQDNPYEAKLFSRVDQWMNASFLMENKVYGAYYRNPDYDPESLENGEKYLLDQSSPKDRTITIQDKQTFDQVFAVDEIGADFDKEVVYVYIFADVYESLNYHLTKVDVGAQVTIEYALDFSLKGDAVMPYGRAFAVKMLRTDATGVLFQEQGSTQSPVAFRQVQADPLFGYFTYEKDMFEVVRSYEELESALGGNQIVVNDICELPYYYNNEFFENKSLVLGVWGSKDGRLTRKVEDVTVSGGKMTVSVLAAIPLYTEIPDESFEVGTDDAVGIFVLEIDKQKAKQVRSIAVQERVGVDYETPAVQPFVNRFHANRASGVLLKDEYAQSRDHGVHLIYSKQEQDLVFDSYPTEVDYDRQMLVVCCYTTVYGRRTHFKDIRLTDDGVLQIEVEMEKGKPGYNDAHAPQKEFFIFYMDKVECAFAEFKMLYL